jgi:hypothetical protein
VTVAAIALFIVIVTLAVVVIRIARRTLDPGWLWVTLALVLSGGLLGDIGRTVTAGSVGANVGGVLAIFVGLPVVVILDGFGIWKMIVLIRR